MTDAAPPTWRSTPLLPWLPIPPRVALMYAAMFFVTGVSTPFLPLWLAQRHISIGEIGVLLVVPSLVRCIAAPAVGWQADRWRSHRRLIIALSVLGLLAWLLFWRTSGFGWALGALVLIALAGTMTPLVESIAVSGVRTDRHDYGRMRLWGSASFIAANLAGSWLASRAGVAPLIGLLIAGAAATLGASVLLPQPAALGIAPAAQAPLSWASAVAVLRVPGMASVLMAAAALQGAHGMYYTYGSLHWQSLGINMGWFGSLWAVGLITEIALFWWSKLALTRFGAAGLIVIGAALSIIRWILMALDPPLALLVPLQMLHGLTFGASHLGAMHVLAKIAPPDKGATAQALYALVSTLGVTLATGIAAAIYPALGGRAYLAMAVLAAVGLYAALRIAKTWRPMDDALEQP